jgi:hypothetical protein
MHDKSIKAIFDEECSHLKINRDFIKKVVGIETGFVNKRQEHVQFFGGALTGVEVVRFTEDDRNKLFIDILQANDLDLQERVHKMPAIETHRIVSSDIFNISCEWLMHAIYNSEYLDDDTKHEGMIRVCMYLQYKFLTSRLYRHFKYPADPEIAAATYASLSYKYALKVHGSWGAALRARADSVVNEKSIWRDVITKMNDDVRVVHMLNDVQGRIRDMLKNIASVHYDLATRGVKIQRSSSLVETDGEMIFKDKSKSMGNYLRYINTIITDKNSFIRQELIDVVASVMPTMSPNNLLKVLEWSSLNHRHLVDNQVEKTIEMVMEHIFEYLTSNKSTVKNKNDLTGLLSKIRGIYMSSRSSDVRLLKIRDAAEKIVKSSTKIKDPSAIAATRTGFMLYIVLRAFTMQHYSNQ